MTAPYRYFKFEISEGNTTSEIVVAEFQLYNNTTNISNGQTATASGFYATTPPSYAVDGNSGTVWSLPSAQPWWFQIALGTPGLITTYKIQASGAYPGYAPKSWILSGSYYGDDWYTIDTRTNETGWSASETRTYTPNGTRAISGTVEDSSGAGCQRTVRVYRRDSGKLLGSADSSASTGAYSIAVEYQGEVNVVKLDDVSGITENDEIHRSTPV